MSHSLAELIDGRHSCLVAVRAAEGYTSALGRRVLRGLGDLRAASDEEAARDIVPAGPLAHLLRCAAGVILVEEVVHEAAGSHAAGVAAVLEGEGAGLARAAGQQGADLLQV